MNPRCTFIRLAAIGLILLVSFPAFAQVSVGLSNRIETETPITKSYRSEGFANLLAVGGTVLPWVFMPSYIESWGEVFRFVAVLSVAPSLGHFYASDWRRGLRLSAIRFGGVGLIGLSIFGSPITAVAGFFTLVAGTIASLATTGRSVRDYNERRAEIEPFADVVNGGCGVTVRLKF